MSEATHPSEARKQMIESLKRLGPDYAYAENGNDVAIVGPPTATQFRKSQRNIR